MMTRRGLVAASLAGVPFAMRAGRSRAADAPEEIKLAVSSTSFVLGGVRIGQQAGLFTRNGLALHIVVMDSGNGAMSALIAGSVPFAVAGPPDTLTARARGQDVVIVASLYAGFAGSVVLGKAVADRLGVSPTAPLKDRLHALDGLVLATPSATSVLTGPIREAAAQAGAKVRFTYMAQGTMPAAVEAKAVDGMVASYPFAGTPILRGTGVLWLDGPAGELPPDVAPSSSSTVEATGAYVAAHRDTVRKLQQALLAVADYVQKDPDGARKALAAGYPELSAQAVDLAFRQQWRNWTKPFLTAADMQQEARLLRASTHDPAIASLDLSKVLVGPQ